MPFNPSKIETDILSENTKESKLNLILSNLALGVHSAHVYPLYNRKMVMLNSEKEITII